MEFLLIHYKALIAIIGGITGLLGVAFTFYSKSQDSKLKLLEMELKKEQFLEDKKHQITKEKYQELFAKKIELYINLQQELYSYYDNILNIGREYFDIDEWGRDNYTKITEKKVIVDLLESINKHFNGNQFLISNKLENKYKVIQKAYSKSKKHFDAMLDLVISDPDEAEEEYDKGIAEFYAKHREDISELIKIIEQEIQEIKLNIGFDS